MTAMRFAGFGATNYDKFSGSQSISSDAYYGTGSSGGGGGGGGGGRSNRGGGPPGSAFGISGLISKLGDMSSR
jgi:hypothetical protein